MPVDYWWQQLKIGALPELVPWSADTCSWKRPLCVMDIPKEVTSADRAYRMRVAHAREAHPKAKRSRFRLPRSHAQQQNVQKATRAKVSAGIAQQMLRLKAGSQGSTTRRWCGCLTLRSKRTGDPAPNCCAPDAKAWQATPRKWQSCPVATVAKEAPRGLGS